MCDIEQINKKLYSVYLYVDIANYYDELDLDGYANYYMIQAQEERDHALLFMKCMQNNGWKVTLEAIAQSPTRLLRVSLILLKRLQSTRDT